MGISDGNPSFALSDGCWTSRASINRVGVHNGKSIERSDLKGKPDISSEGGVGGHECDLLDKMRVFSEIDELQATDIA